MADLDPYVAYSRESLIAMLRWQLEVGITEALSPEPYDRFSAASAVLSASDSSQELPPAYAPTGDSPLAQARRNKGRTAAAPPPAAVEAKPVNLADLHQIKDLDGLQAAVEAFEGSSLKRYATNTVFGDGTTGARIICVGDAPGAEEDRRGVPFVGPNGKLLDRMLAAIGFARTDVYITNTLYWRPPGNRTPTPEERAQCLPFLMRQIELVEPRAIIALGGPAAQTLLNEKTGITRLRGKWFDFQTRPGLAGGLELPLLPTFHPAFLLSQPAQKREAWKDLRAVRDKLAAEA
jgi:DNA polymerase